MEEIIQQLKKLGLSDYEAQIYSVLLKNSPASATLIAKKCNLSRSSVYTTLSTLISKGLVGTTYRNEVKQFIAQDHSSLEQLLNKEENQLKEKFQSLEKLKNTFLLMGKSSLNVPDIIFFEGQEGLKKIYLSMMRQAQENSTLYLLRDEFVWQPEWQFIFESKWHAKVKKIKTEKNIQTKLLVNNSHAEINRRKLYQSKKSLQYKFLPKQQSVSQFAIYIISDIVSILSMEKNNLVGTKISNQHMADNFKSIFDGLWKSSKLK